MLTSFIYFSNCSSGLPTGQTFASIHGCYLSTFPCLSICLVRGKPGTKFSLQLTASALLIGPTSAPRLPLTVMCLSSRRSPPDRQTHNGLSNFQSLLKLTQFFIPTCSGDLPTGPTFASIHGGDTQTIRAADLRLERFLSEADMAGAAAAAPATQLPAQAEVVFLTGANGFLGRFLLLQLLQSVSAK